MTLTTREAAVIGAYTGVLLGKFDDMHAYIEEVLGRPVFTHELGLNEGIRDEIRAAARTELLEICGPVLEPSE